MGVGKPQVSPELRRNVFPGGAGRELTPTVGILTYVLPSVPVLEKLYIEPFNLIWIRFGEGGLHQSHGSPSLH